MKYQLLPHPFAGNWVHVPHDVLVDLWRELSLERNLVGLFRSLKAGSPFDIDLSTKTPNIAAKYHPLRALGERVFVVDIEIQSDSPNFSHFGFTVLITPDIIHPLLGDVEIIEKIQKQATFENCSDNDAVIYLKFFTLTVVDGKSRFLPIETMKNLDKRVYLEKFHEHAAIKANDGIHMVQVKNLAKKWVMKVPILYDGALYSSKFELSREGVVTMTEDRPLIASDEVNIVYRVSPTLVRSFLQSQEAV